MVLVAGATGALGLQVARLLRREGRAVRALYRDSSAAAAVRVLQDAGTECVRGDLRDGAAIQAACECCAVVVSTASAITRQDPGNTLAAADRDGQVALVRAAVRAGVRRLVLVSFALPPGSDNGFPLATAKQAVESELQHSGLEYLILHPAPFMETWLSPLAGFDPVQGKVRIIGSGDNRVSFIATGDVAHCVAAAVRHPQPQSGTVPLGGPEAVRWNEAVARFEVATGRRFTVERTPADALRAQIGQVADPKLQSLLGLALATSMDWIVDPGTATARLGVPAADWVTLEDYIGRVARTLVPAADG